MFLNDREIVNTYMCDTKSPKANMFPAKNLKQNDL